MNQAQSIAEGVKRAQKIARDRGLKIGEVVSHPSNEWTYGLLALNGNIATVGWSESESPTGKKVEKEFPLDELFNPNDALKEARAIQTADITRLLPRALVVDID